MQSTTGAANPVEIRHGINIDRSIKELQDRIAEHQEELARLQRDGKTDDAALGSSRRAPFEIMKTAFDQVSQDAPFTPSPHSVLPGLLALRKAHQTTVDSKTYLASQTASMDQATRQLETERARLRDQELLTTSLQARIQTLRENLENGMELDPDQAARERLSELRQKKKSYDRETARLFKDLGTFIDEHLAAQLAAEDLGGPVVGDRVDIDAEDLVAGFNAQGKQKKAPAKQDEGKRQRRLEEVWGPAFAAREAEDVPDETAAAGHELRDLVEELLNLVVRAGGDSGAAYVQLPKETAAARFLVRSKVAQFHPRDATRIKIIDFGREIDD